MSDASCLVHVGTYKTGTTSIQRFLAINRSQFASAGIYFPTSGCHNAPDYVSHHQLVYDAVESAAFRPQYGGLEALSSELRHCGARFACISSENISALWDNPRALVRLRDAILSAGFTPRIVCYLRPQASYARSIYAQIVTYGAYRQPFDIFLRETLEHGRYLREAGNGIPLDYDRLLCEFCDVFGGESLVVRRYSGGRPNNVLLAEFAALLVSADVAAGLLFPTSRENDSSDFATVLERLGVSQEGAATLRFAPLRLRDLWRVRQRFRRANATIAERYAFHLASMELDDIALAVPFRRTWKRTRALWRFRDLLRNPGRGPES